MSSKPDDFTEESSSAMLMSNAAILQNWSRWRLFATNKLDWAHSKLCMDIEKKLSLAIKSKKGLCRFLRSSVNPLVIMSYLHSFKMLGHLLYDALIDNLYLYLFFNVHDYFTDMNNQLVTIKNWFISNQQMLNIDMKHVILFFNVNDCFNNMNNQLIRIKNWFTSKKLTISVNMIHVIIFFRRKSPFPNTHVEMRCQPIANVT